MLRKHALITWLIDAIDRESSNSFEENVIDQILDNITRGKIDLAVEIAIKSGKCVFAHISYFSEVSKTEKLNLSKMIKG